MWKSLKKIMRCFTDFSTNMYFYKYPNFILYKPNFHQVKSSEYKSILLNLKPGDILIRRAKGYLSTILIPGYWSHMGIYTGRDFIINAVPKRGIVKDHLFDYLKTDSIGILRVKNEKLILDAIDHAENLFQMAASKNIDYDYIFESNNENLYCSELIDICYKGIFKDDYKNVNSLINKKVISPDGIYLSLEVEKIIEYRH